MGGGGPRSLQCGLLGSYVAPTRRITPDERVDRMEKSDCWRGVAVDSTGDGVELGRRIEAWQRVTLGCLIIVVQQE